MKNNYLLFVMIVAFIGFSGCVKDDYKGPDPTLPSRTLIVYLGGDESGISATLEQEVEAMRQGWIRTGNRCLIYIDPVDGPPRLVSLRGGCQVSPIPWIETLATYEEENSASAEVFARVIRDVIARQPADGYGLFITSHASGWLPTGTLDNSTRSIIHDENRGESSAGSEMELADLAGAIPDGQFDFIILEACLTSGVEVAYALRDKTDLVLASSAELLQPGYVPILPQSLHYLMETKYTAAESLTLFAKSYFEHAQSDEYHSATQSLIATAKLDALADAVKGIYATSTATPDIGTLQYFDRYKVYSQAPAPRFFDLLDHIEQIANPEQYAQIESLVDEIVLWKAATPGFLMGHTTYKGFPIDRHSGLTTYVEQDCYPQLNRSYRQTAWWQATHDQK